MSFEEEFPSLKDWITYDGDSNEQAVVTFDIERFCLDKQRVKEIINNKQINLSSTLRSGIHSYAEIRDNFVIPELNRFKEELKKELGL